MYGCTTVSVFAFSVLVLSTGFTVAYPKAPTLFRKPPGCTSKDLSVSVKCPLEHRREVHLQSNRSSCCLLSASNSSHPSEACASGEERVTMSTTTNAKSRESAARSESISYRLRACEGTNVRLVCEVNMSCSDVVRWRSTDGTAFVRRALPLPNVQREDAGTYVCEVTDTKGKIKVTGIVTLEVQFAPIITVPNSSVSVWTESEDVLECQSEGNPKPTITWYRDGALLAPAPSLHATSSESEDCRTTSFVLFNVRNASSSSYYSSEDVVLQNYTCVAENELGKAAATFLIASFIEESSNSSGTIGRRRFNVTGFIVGMLPPLLISFYIILKLGYRSRYAEERGEDDGYREEPFFISY